MTICTIIMATVSYTHLINSEYAPEYLKEAAEQYAEVWQIDETMFVHGRGCLLYTSSVLLKAMQYLHMIKRDFVFQFRKNQFRISCDDIVYFEKKGRQAVIHTCLLYTSRCV